MSVKEEPKFQFGDLVYAKVQGYPHWPARIDCIQLSRYNKAKQDDDPEKNEANW